MAKQIQEIRNFGKGIANSVSPEDLPEDASPYSKNIHPHSAHGIIKGIPSDQTIIAGANFEKAKNALSTASVPALVIEFHEFSSGGQYLNIEYTGPDYLFTNTLTYTIRDITNTPTVDLEINGVINNVTSANTIINITESGNNGIYQYNWATELTRGTHTIEVEVGQYQATATAEITIPANDAVDFTFTPADIGPIVLGPDTISQPAIQIDWEALANWGISEEAIFTLYFQDIDSPTTYPGNMQKIGDSIVQTFASSTSGSVIFYQTDLNEIMGYNIPDYSTNKLIVHLALGEEGGASCNLQQEGSPNYTANTTPPTDASWQISYYIPEEETPTITMLPNIENFLFREWYPITLTTSVPSGVVNSNVYALYAAGDITTHSANTIGIESILINAVALANNGDENVPGIANLFDDGKVHRIDIWVQSLENASITPPMKIYTYTPNSGSPSLQDDEITFNLSTNALYSNAIGDEEALDNLSDHWDDNMTLAAVIMYKSEVLDSPTAAQETTIDGFNLDNQWTPDDATYDADYDYWEPYKEVDDLDCVDYVESDNEFNIKPVTAVAWLKPAVNTSDGLQLLYTPEVTEETSITSVSSLLGQANYFVFETLSGLDILSDDVSIDMVDRLSAAFDIQLQYHRIDSSTQINVQDYDAFTENQTGQANGVWDYTKLSDTKIRISFIPHNATIWAMIDEMNPSFIASEDITNGEDYLAIRFKITPKVTTSSGIVITNYPHWSGYTPWIRHGGTENGS